MDEFPTGRRPCWARDLSPAGDAGGVARAGRAGADLIAVPCNTAHAFLPHLRGVSRRTSLT
jgi:hypothetical protein